MGQGGRGPVGVHVQGEWCIGNVLRGGFNWFCLTGGNHRWRLRSPGQRGLAVRVRVMPRSGCLTSLDGDGKDAEHASGKVKIVS